MKRIVIAVMMAMGGLARADVQPPPMGPRDLLAASEVVVVARAVSEKREQKDKWLYRRVTYQVLDTIRGTAQREVILEARCDRSTPARPITIPNDRCLDPLPPLSHDRVLLYLTAPYASEIDGAQVRAHVGYGAPCCDATPWPDGIDARVALLRKLSPSVKPYVPEGPQCMRGPRDYFHAAQVVVLARFDRDRTRVFVTPKGSVQVERLELTVTEVLRGDPALKGKTIVGQRIAPAGSSPAGDWQQTFKAGPGAQDLTRDFYLREPLRSEYDGAIVYDVVPQMRPGTNCDTQLIRADAPDRLAKLRDLAATVKPAP